MTKSLPTGRGHVDELVQAASAFGPSIEVAERWGHHLAHRLSSGARLLAAGNGGSAAQAQHLTAELVGRYGHERRPLSAICLTAETSSLTAIINDYAPSELYARQVEAHGRRGDVLILMSTSGAQPKCRRGCPAGSHPRAPGLGVHRTATQPTCGNGPRNLGRGVVVHCHGARAPSRGAAPGVCGAGPRTGVGSSMPGRRRPDTASCPQESRVTRSPEPRAHC
ncbi:MAG: SIS domain-containing protein [Nocardioidaceae bacterium]